MNILKINVFKILNEQIDDLKQELENIGYKLVVELEDESHYMSLYLKRKSADSQGWIDYYKDILEKKDYQKYSENLGSETLSGVYLINNNDYTFAVVHGQAHFIVRKYCDKDFGLDLAERIVDPIGLKMKHSQTFSSSGKKDITSYSQKRNFDNSFDYGEAFSYVKCKTNNNRQWGETADFGESVRFTSNKDLNFKVGQLFNFTDVINNTLSKQAHIHLPRYRKVMDKTVLDVLNEELKKHFLDFLTNVDVDDYWLTGVSFNFSNDYKYSLKIRTKDLTGILDTLDAKAIRDVVSSNNKFIKNRYDLIKVIFYDEEDRFLFSKQLQDLLQITLTLNDKYYVLYHNEWVEFSESYVKFIEEQVDNIEFLLKDSYGLGETDLIEKLVKEESYTKLHKKNVYIGKYCIEQADLMDEDNIIMIKDQANQADLVYLIKQATTSLRLTESRELNENIFSGRNVCLWMLVNRKSLTKLSDFKSFHLLDALNDFKKEVTSKNLNPIIWISLDKS